MKNKPQILIIHGGMTFKNKKDYLSFLKNMEVDLQKSKKWSNQYLDEKLGSSFEIIRPSMPLKENAKYEEWRIYFEKYIPKLKNDLILIGNSLGGIFLAKYLSENRFPKKIKSIFLIGPPFDNTCHSEDLVGGFELKKDLSLIEQNTENLYLMFSEDDGVVPVSHAKKYREKLKTAKIIIYKSKNGHFKITSFPEIVRIIKSLNQNTRKTKKA